MATYLIGDVHGCYKELTALLKQVEFSPAQGDALWLSGDLVARGPNSLEVLRYIKSLGDSARVVLGNHDLHLLSLYEDFTRKNSKSRNYSTLFFESEDAEELLDWLRRQPLLQVDESKKLVMSHAGITPQWDLNTAKECAFYVEKILKSDSYQFLLEGMYGDAPSSWSQSLSGLPRLRFILNAFTRMRYCLSDGRLNMHFKSSPENTPLFLKPWFNIPGLIDKSYSIAFGHWASLLMEEKSTPEGIYALDAGCCWGGNLICLRWEDKKYFLHPSYQ